MSKVQTFKCDICGEVYHKDPDDRGEMLINYATVKGDIEERTYCEHICPRCAANVRQLIKNPEIIQKEHLSRSILERCMNEIYHLGLGDIVASFWYGAHDPSYYEDIKRRIIENYESLEKSRDRWQYACKCFAGLAIGLLIGNIITMFI